jgi:hypothetical protein
MRVINSESKYRNRITKYENKKINIHIYEFGNYIVNDYLLYIFLYYIKLYCFKFSYTFSNKYLTNLIIQRWKKSITRILNNEGFPKPYINRKINGNLVNIFTKTHIKDNIDFINLIRLEYLFRKNIINKYEKILSSLSKHLLNVMLYEFLLKN